MKEVSLSGAIISGIVILGAVLLASAIFYALWQYGVGFIWSGRPNATFAQCVVFTAIVSFLRVAFGKQDSE